MQLHILIQMMLLSNTEGTQTNLEMQAKDQQQEVKTKWELAIEDPLIMNAWKL